MKERKSGFVSSAGIYGSLTGLALIIFAVILYVAGISSQSSLNLLQWVIIFAGLHLGTKAFRDNTPGGHITYGRALIFGLCICLVAGFLTSVFTYLLIQYDPSIIERNLAIAEESMEKISWIPSEAIGDSLEKSRRLMDSLWSIPINLLTFMLFGFIVTLITSAIVKKNKSPFD